MLRGLFRYAPVRLVITSRTDHWPCASRADTPLASAPAVVRPAWALVGAAEAEPGVQPAGEAVPVVPPVVAAAPAVQPGAAEAVVTAALPGAAAEVSAAAVRVARLGAASAVGLRPAALSAVSPAVVRVRRRAAEVAVALPADAWPAESPHLAAAACRASCLGVAAGQRARCSASLEPAGWSPRAPAALLSLPVSWASLSLLQAAATDQAALAPGGVECRAVCRAHRVAASASLATALWLPVQWSTASSSMALSWTAALSVVTAVRADPATAGRVVQGAAESRRERQADPAVAACSAASSCSTVASCCRAVWWAASCRVASSPAAAPESSWLFARPKAARLDR